MFSNLLCDIPWTGKVESTAFTIGSLTVNWYGIIITLSMILGLFYAIKKLKKLNVNADCVTSLFLISIPIAIIGARLGFVVSHYKTYFVSPFTWSDFVDMIAIWNGGLTIMWGVPFGVLGGFIWAKIYKKHFFDVVSIVIPVVLLCQAIGRWGNFFNQELYGQLITNPNAQWFPLAVYIANKGAWYQATFFYESVLNLIGFFAVSYAVKHVDVKGIGIIGYVGWYSLVRGSLEFIRDDGNSSFDGAVNWNIVLCYVLVALAVALAVFLIIRKKKQGKQVFYRKETPVPDYVIKELAEQKDNPNLEKK